MRTENITHPVGPDHRRLHLDLTYAADVMLQEHGSGSEHMVKHVRAIEAEASALALARAAERVGLHEGLECCDPKTLEHVYQALAPQATE